jgi:hypothetical protein
MSQLMRVQNKEQFVSIFDKIVAKSSAKEKEFLDMTSGSLAQFQQSIVTDLGGSIGKDALALSKIQKQQARDAKEQHKADESWRGTTAQALSRIQGALYFGTDYSISKIIVDQKDLLTKAMMVIAGRDIGKMIMHSAVGAKMLQGGAAGKLATSAKGIATNPYVLAGVAGAAALGGGIYMMHKEIKGNSDLIEAMNEETSKLRSRLEKTSTASELPSKTITTVSNKDAKADLMAKQLEVAKESLNTLSRIAGHTARSTLPTFAEVS